MGNAQSIKLCEQCGMSFTSYQSQKRRFCSHSCKVDNQTGKERVAFEPCGFCGKPFKPYKHQSGRTRFCSTQCGARGRYAALGALGVDAPSRKRERRIEYLHEYRTKKRLAFVAAVDARSIYERDSGICGICKKPIAFEEISLDHIMPISRGGTHEPNNVQIAHMPCNSRKGNRWFGQLRLLLA